MSDEHPYYDSVHDEKLKDINTLIAGMDRRQLRIFRQVLEANGEVEDEWDHIMYYSRLKIWSEYEMKDEATTPKYRARALRLKQIRTDHKWTLEEFAEKLSSPQGQEPLLEKNLVWNKKTMADLEYGNLKIDEEIAQLCLVKFGVGHDWLLHGKGHPHSKTNTLSIPRITHAEHRLLNLEEKFDGLVGKTKIIELFENGHPMVMRNPDGSYVLKNAATVALRMELWEAQKNISDLKNLIEKQDTIIDYMKEKLDSFHDEFYGTPRDREHTYQTAIQDLEEKVSALESNVYPPYEKD